MNKRRTLATITTSLLLALLPTVAHAAPVPESRMDRSYAGPGTHQTVHRYQWTAQY